jgi:stage II sporulation protein AA (anti-sigma F factor antagonist)
MKGVEMEVMTRTSEKNPKVMVVSLTGNLDTRTSPAARLKIVEALEQSAIGLLMDLSALQFISSAGISVLLDVNKKAQDGGKKVGLCRAQPSVYKLFKITELDKVLRFFEEEEDALQALWPQA